MTFNQPPTTPLPQGPPAPPAPQPVARGLVDHFLTALGYDPRWVIAARITPAEVVVDVVAGELYPIAVTRRHPFTTPTPVPLPGDDPGTS